MRIPKVEQYPIPQFIEAEAKIAFFISFRQFFYLVGGGVIIFILYLLAPFYIFVVFGFLIFVVSLTLAFLTINGMPVINILLNSFGFLMGSKNYVWRKKEQAYPFKTIKSSKIQRIEEAPVLKAQQSRLKKIHTQVEMRTK